MKKAMLALGLCLLLALAAPAAAQSAADFYKGRQIFLQIGEGAGGSYDVVGRLFARYMGQHIPGNPKLVPQNVPGGGSLALANQFGNTTARDGSVFGLFNNGVPLTPLLNPPAAHFDPRKFNFLGSPSREVYLLIAWHTSPVKTFDELFTKELIVGATSPGAAPYDFPLLTNTLIGTKFKIVTGYPGGLETQLAMQRGEIQANAGVTLSAYNTGYRDARERKDVFILAAFGMQKSAAIPEVPLLPTGKTDEERQLFELMYARQSFGRLFLTPPDVPADRVEALRQGFEATLKDPEFLAEAKRIDLDIDPVSAKELTELTDRLFKTPPAVLERMQKLLNPSGK